MPIYDVEVVVHLNYEVEADSPEQAEEQGWLWEDYIYNSEVYSIHIDEQEEEDEVKLDEEVI
jgi:hypothetical protein